MNERYSSSKATTKEEQKKEKEFNSPIKPALLHKKKPLHSVGIGSSIAAARDRDNGKGLPIRQLADDEMNLFAMLEGSPKNES